jgi:hypothetical protein
VYVLFYTNELLDLINTVVFLFYSSVSLCKKKVCVFKVFYSHTYAYTLRSEIIHVLVTTRLFQTILTIDSHPSRQTMKVRTSDFPIQRLLLHNNFLFMASPNKHTQRTSPTAQRILALNRIRFGPFTSGRGHKRGVVPPWPFASALHPAGRCIF